MGKPKGQPKNFLRYFLDEFILLERDFYAESMLSPEDIAKNLGQVEANYEQLAINKRRVKSSIKQQGKGWQFELFVRQRVGNRHSEYRDSKTAIITGKISLAEDGTTIIEGQSSLVTMPLVVGTILSFIAFVFLGGLMSLFGMFSAEYYFIPVVFLVGVGFLWFRSYQDRNHLLNLIQSVVESSHEYDDKSKAS